MSEEYKCKDCKWLTGRKNIRGIECMNPVLQEKWNGAKNLWMGELRKDTARYKQRNAPACKKFKAKESEHMGRYIDADALIERWNNMSVRGRTEFDQEIMVAPSIDIVPKRGEWIYQFRDSESEEYRCSACGYPQVVKANFCPNCGADMREREGE